MVRDNLVSWLVGASAVLFVVIELTGELAQQAVLVPGFIALGFAWRGSLANGATAAALWLAALVATEPMLHRHIDPAWLISVAVALFSIGLIRIATPVAPWPTKRRLASGSPASRAASPIAG